MKNNPLVKAGGVLVLVLVLAALAGCVSSSPETVAPGTQITESDTVTAGDCFFRVNDSAHSGNAGSSREITITGYVSNTCTRPMENLIVRGTFYDRNGKAFASSEGSVGRVGYHEIVPFNLSVSTGYPDLYTYELEPVIRERRAFF